MDKIIFLKFLGEITDSRLQCFEVAAFLGAGIVAVEKSLSFLLLLSTDFE